ncbi:OmpA family protein [Methylobacterium sp. JK268]
MPTQTDRAMTLRTAGPRHLRVLLAALALGGFSTPVPAAGPARAAGTEADSRSFALDQVPVSAAPLGAFPYLGLPDGYAWHNAGKGETRSFDQFPFWTGSGIEMAEGKLFMGRIEAADGTTYAPYEVARNVAALVAQAGGVRVTKSRIPGSITETWDEDIRVEKSAGLGDVYNRPAEVFVIHRADRAIWIHFLNDSHGGNMAVLETKPFAATATLLPASAAVPASTLAQALADQGKAVIHVNFASDATEILPDSRPQIDAIAQVLKDQPTLRLAINGYTDETGSAAHNRTLSEGRAASVRQALVAAGIDASRLTSKGFGSSGAVADNGTEAGRAQNRRVELVRVPARRP